METFKNPQGIQIAQGCISCVNFKAGMRKISDGAPTEPCVCEFDNSQVKRDDLCGLYKCRKELMDCGSGAPGQVHSPEYVLFVRAHLDEARMKVEDFEKANANNPERMTHRLTIVGVIHEMWRQHYGNKSKYINI